MLDSLYEIRILFIREMRAALRERGIVINSILVPLLLYPFMMWFAFSVIGFVIGQGDRQPSRLVIGGLSAAHEDLRSRFEDDERFVLVEPPPDDLAAALRAREIDLAASFEPAEEAGGADNFRVILSLQSAEERSQTAEKRFDEVLGEYRRDWTRRSARELGISDAEWEMLSVETRNIASSESVGAFLLALIVPLLMILMITAGCFYPAVDTTAGERERSTWETLMSSGARRSSVLVSKYLYVAALGTVAGLLNLIAMTLSMRALLAPLLGDSSDEVTFTLPWRALPLMLLTALLLALFIAALMMLFAVFARTFKEGQAMIGPAYMVCMLPPLFVMSPDLELTLGWAAIPVANVALLFRGAMTGTVTWTLALAVLAVQAALIVLLLALARWILSIEEVLTGSYGGSLGKLIFSRLKGGRFGHREADPAEEKRRE